MDKADLAPWCLLRGDGVKSDMPAPLTEPRDRKEKTVAPKSVREGSMEKPAPLVADGSSSVTDRVTHRLDPTGQSTAGGSSGNPRGRRGSLTTRRTPLIGHNDVAL